MSLLTDREVSRDGNTPPLPTSKPRRKLPRVYVAIVASAGVDGRFDRRLDGTHPRQDRPTGHPGRPARRASLASKAP